MKTAQDHADDLKSEAKTLLNKIFRDSNLTYTFGDVDRIVDCLVSASILTIASVQAEAMQTVRVSK